MTWVTTVPVGVRPFAAVFSQGSLWVANLDDGTVRILDLSAVTYLDSAGIRLILGVNERLALRRQQLRLVVPPGAPIQRLIEITRLGVQVPIFASATDAATGAGAG